MAMVNKTKYALLGILSISPMSGYDIKKFSDRSISYFWNENYAHIYPVLKDMEIAGLVVKKTAQTEGRPPKNIYSITDMGRKELQEWLLQPAEEYRPRIELLLKLFFSSNVPVENLIEKVADEKEKHKKFIEEYIKIENNLKTDERIKNQKGLPLWLATVNFGLCESEAIIKWCDETLESLEAMR